MPSVVEVSAARTPWSIIGSVINRPRIALPSAIAISLVCLWLVWQERDANLGSSQNGDAAQQLAQPTTPDTGAGQAKADPFTGARAGQPRDDNGLQTTLVWIPPGKFKMGSPKNEKGRDDDNEAQVQVTLTKGFWLGQTEVTQSEWQRVMSTAPWRSGKDKKYVKEGDDYPAVYVSWDDAMKFCKTLTATDRVAGRLTLGWQYTLPTEAQWEYACLRRNYIPVLVR